MWRPEYRENAVIFDLEDPVKFTANLSSTATMYADNISTVSSALAQKDSVRISTASYYLQTMAVDAGGVGAFIGIEGSRKEAYSVQMTFNGECNQTAVMQGFLAVLEAAHSPMTVQDAKLLRWLPSRVTRQSAFQQVTTECIIYPHTNPEDYASWANVTGLVVGIGMNNAAGANAQVKGDWSIGISRWVEPHVTHTPVN